MGGREIEKILIYLTVETSLASSTQNQALNTILFLSKKILKQEFN